MAVLHPTALIAPGAVLGENVSVGAFSILGDGVVLGDNCQVADHVTITGRTQIGANNVFHPYACIGGPPQMRGDKLGRPTELVMGDENVVREFVTINCGTEKGGGRTIVGNRGLFMACSHIAHDCVVGNDVLLVNNVLLGGHIRVDDKAILSGGCALHHFTSVGMLAFIGGLTRIVQDVPPFLIVEGHPASVRGVNVIGLRRNGASEESIERLLDVYRLLYKSKRSMGEALAELSKRDDLTTEGKILVDFLRQMERGKHGRAREALRE